MSDPKIMIKHVELTECKEQPKETVGFPHLGKSGASYSQSRRTPITWIHGAQEVGLASLSQKNLEARLRATEGALLLNSVLNSIIKLSFKFESSLCALQKNLKNIQFYTNKDPWAYHQRIIIADNLLNYFLHLFWSFILLGCAFSLIAGLT